MSSYSETPASTSIAKPAEKPAENLAENPAPRRRNTRLIILAVLGVVLGLLVAYVGIRLATGQPLVGPPRLNGIVMQSPQPMPNFTLTGHDNQQHSLHDYRDKVVLLYFGYTYCPDVCPATMWELSQAVEALPEKARDQVQVIMVSVDPERDTLKKLADYVAHFNPSFIAMTGTMDDILAATTPFGIYFEAHEGSAESGYLIDHTASVTVLDKDGYMRLVYPFNTPAEDISADLAVLARE